MKPLKSEKHHWWPKCVSAHWQDDNGKVNRVDACDNVTRSNPENFGVIRNGHHIKLDYVGGEPTVWDSSFEREFDRADRNFPKLIEWLGGLIHHDDDSTYGRFTEQAASDEQIDRLIECAVSLVVRGPRNREASVGLAEHLRGPLEPRERNALISLNMHRKQQMIVRSFSCRGKFAVFF